MEGVFWSIFTTRKGFHGIGSVISSLPPPSALAFYFSIMDFGDDDYDDRLNERRRDHINNALENRDRVLRLIQRVNELNDWHGQNPTVTVGGREYDRATVTEVVVPEGVTELKYNTFYGCRNLVSISLPNSLTRIGNSAFLNCTSLVSISIPPSVTHIDYWAFAQCSSLALVNVHPSTEIDLTAFIDCTTLNNLAAVQNLSDVEYVRLQCKIKQDRINLRVIVHMCTNSKIAHDLHVVQPQLDEERVIAAGELDGVLAVSKLYDDVWRVIVDFL